jgi:1,4-dihydroxy-2-naphthoate octaprenyltransferase
VNKINLTLDKKISKLLDENGCMALSTSVDGNSSGDSVFYARDGKDLVFFTFNSDRKAEQIRVNPRVQAVVWSKGHEGVCGLQIEGLCFQIKDKDEENRTRDLILETTTAFREIMNDPFLIKNKVAGYYRIKPTLIKYINPKTDEKSEQREYPENKIPVFKDFTRSVLSRAALWIRAVRAPFFTASIVPILLGAVIAYNGLLNLSASAAWDWQMFWLVLFGGILAQAGTNLGNDYFDHTSGNDEYNKAFSPFNGGSRMIQAGLMAPWKVLLAAIISFSGTILIGLKLNQIITGSYFGNSPLLWVGVLGVALGVFYTWNPVRLSYHGWGEISIALGFGPVMVLGSHYVLSAPYLNANGLPWLWQMPLLASIPVAILIMLVVWINQFQDLPADMKAGKINWVVRLAEYNGSRIAYEKPFRFYIFFTYFSFAFILMLGVIGFVKPSLATPFVLISLLPVILVHFAIRWGKEWLVLWNKPDADLEKLPYELLRVNVSTIGIHFLTGSLMILGYWLNSVF